MNIGYDLRTLMQNMHIENTRSLLWRLEINPLALFVAGFVLPGKIHLALS